MCVAGGESDDGDAEVEVADGARELVVADMLGVAAAELAEAGLAPPASQVETTTSVPDLAWLR